MAAFLFNLPSFWLCHPGLTLPSSLAGQLLILPLLGQPAWQLGEMELGLVVGWIWGWRAGRDWESQQSAKSPAAQPAPDPITPPPSRPPSADSDRLQAQVVALQSYIAQLQSYITRLEQALEKTASSPVYPDASAAAITVSVLAVSQEPHPDQAEPQNLDLEDYLRLRGSKNQAYSLANQDYWLTNLALAHQALADRIPETNTPATSKNPANPKQPGDLIPLPLVPAAPYQAPLPNIPPPSLWPPDVPGNNLPSVALPIGNGPPIADPIVALPPPDDPMDTLIPPSSAATLAAHTPPLGFSNREILPNPPETPHSPASSPLSPDSAMAPPLTLVHSTLVPLAKSWDPHIDPDSDPLQLAATSASPDPTETPAPSPDPDRPGCPQSEHSQPEQHSPGDDRTNPSRPFSPAPLPDRQDFLSLHRQGRIYLQQQDYGAAQATLQAALVGYRPQKSVGLTQVAAVLADLAQVYAHQGQKQAQETCLKRALHCCGVVQTEGTPQDANLAVAIVTALIDLYWHQGRWTEAAALFPLVLRLHHHNGSSESEAMAIMLQRWGEVCLNQGRPAKAEACLRAALNIYRRQGVTKRRVLLRCRRLLAQIQGDQGHGPDALGLLERLLAEFPLGTPELCEEQVAIVRTIGVLYQSQGQPLQALMLCRQAILHCEPILGHYHPLIQMLQSQVTDLQASQTQPHDPKDAAILYPSAVI